MAALQRVVPSVRRASDHLPVWVDVDVLGS